MDVRVPCVVFSVSTNWQVLYITQPNLRFSYHVRIGSAVNVVSQRATDSASNQTNHTSYSHEMTRRSTGVQFGSGRSGEVVHVAEADLGFGCTVRIIVSGDVSS